MRTTRNITGSIAAILCLALLAAAPTSGGSSLARASETARCDKHHPLNCQRAIGYWKHLRNQAATAAEWQRTQRVRESKKVGEMLLGPYARAVAAARLAEATCIAYLGPSHDCPPASETLLIARCESGIQEHDPNPASTADGPHQYLADTWAGTGFGMFSRTEMLPSFLAIELFGANHHRTYAPWAASRGCHHLP
jgi:hypothetical protein